MWSEDLEQIVKALWFHGIENKKKKKHKSNMMEVTNITTALKNWKHMTVDFHSLLFSPCCFNFMQESHFYFPSEKWVVIYKKNVKKALFYLAQSWGSKRQALKGRLKNCYRHFTSLKASAPPLLSCSSQSIRNVIISKLSWNTKWMADPGICLGGALYRLKNVPL